MMFVDAAAIVAILGKEEEAVRCAEAITGADSPFTSPIAVWEAALALSRPDRLGLSVENSSAIVRLFLEDTGVEVRQLPPPEITLAGSIEAAARIRDRKQRLNLADCFHYAMAKHHNATMLSTANEFKFTDLETVP